MEKKIHWHLYNSENEQKMEFGSTSEAIEFLKHQPETQDLFCWREGFDDWKEVSQVPDFAPAFEKAPEMTAPQPPPPPAPGRINKKHQEKIEVDIDEGSVPKTGPFNFEFDPPSGPILIPIEPITEVRAASPLITEDPQPDFDCNLEVKAKGEPQSEIKIESKSEPQPEIKVDLRSEPTQKTKRQNTSDQDKSSQKEATAHKRKHERYDLKFRVIVRSKQITFRTFSKNISLGGIATEHPIPRELINEDCSVYIANPIGSENIKFNVRFATERQDTKYFYFTEISPTSENKLKNWIEALNKQFKKSA